jgi:hypothetical protein
VQGTRLCARLCTRLCAIMQIIIYGVNFQISICQYYASVLKFRLFYTKAGIKYKELGGMASI